MFKKIKILGLGNLMFQFATLRVFAEKYNAFLIIPTECLLRRAFKSFKRILLMPSFTINQFIEKNSNRIKVFSVWNFSKKLTHEN